MKNERAFNLMNLPRIHWDARIDLIPDGCPHKETIRGWADGVLEHVERGDNLLLWGDYGYGKSACAAIMLKAALRWGQVGMWIMAEEYLNAIFNNIHYSEDQTVEQRCRDAPLLVIDELILRDKAQQKEIMLEGLIRSRLETRRTTLITTNHPLSFISANHKGLASVLKGHFWLVQPRGNNFRESYE